MRNQGVNGLRKEIMKDDLMKKIFSCLNEQDRVEGSRSPEALKEALKKRGAVAQQREETGTAAQRREYHPLRIGGGSPYYNGWDRFLFMGQEYSIYTPDPDALTLEDKCYGEWGPVFNEFVVRMKDRGEYFVPGTDVPRYIVAKTGAAIRRKMLYFADGSCTELSHVGIRFYQNSGKEIAVILANETDHFSEANVIKLPSPIVDTYHSAAVLDDGTVLTCRDERCHLVVNREDILAALSLEEYSLRGEFLANDNGEEVFLPDDDMGDRIARREFGVRYHLSALVAEVDAEIAEEAAKRQREKERQQQLAKEAAGTIAEKLLPLVKGEIPMLDVEFGDWYCDWGKDNMKDAVIYIDGKEVPGRYVGMAEGSVHCLFSRCKSRNRNCGVLISVAWAIRNTRNGILHLNVPKNAMGSIIGSGGETIKATTEALREKGVKNLRMIKLHPQK